MLTCCTLACLDVTLKIVSLKILQDSSYVDHLVLLFSGFVNLLA